MILLIISSGIARAQAPDSLINHFFAQYPNEQVYLQLDNHYYFPGDTVWYKAYVTDNGEPSYITRSLYVDWFDGQGLGIAHQAIPLVNGMGSAQYALPSGLTGKRVHVLAYTRWMLNDSGNFAFHKDLTLIQQPANKPYKSTAGTIASNPTIRFFPEGGSLIAGLLNKVVVKATRGDGSPAEIDGVVKDNMGRRVADFFSDEQGLGYFYLTPSGASTYTAQRSDVADSGTTSQMPLPRVQSTGVAMEVQSEPGEQKVTLRRSADLSGSYYLLGTSNSGVTYLAMINLTNQDSAIIDIPVEGYVDFTLTLTVLDSKWTPLAERILFVRGEDRAKQSQIDLSVQKNGLSPRGENRILLHYAGGSAANISIAVTDATLPNGNTNQLFYDSSADAAEELNLLAQTTEWKHKDWKAILTRQVVLNKYPRDTSHYSLFGRTQKNPAKADRLLFLIKRQDYMALDTVVLTANGVLADSAMILFGTTRLAYRPTPPQKNYTFLFDQLPPPAWDQYPFPDEPTASTNFPGSDTADLSQRYGKILQSVTVKSARRVSKMDSLEKVYESERIRHSEGYLWDLEGRPVSPNFQFFVHVLQDEVPDFPSRRFTENGNPIPISKYIWLVDENPVPFQALADGNFPPIVLVKYFPLGQNSFGNTPLVALYTKKDDFNAKRPLAGSNEYILTSYTRTQSYDTLTWQPGASAGHPADLRRTLYWNPSVLVDANKNSVQLSFTNNELGGPIRIIIDGMDENGRSIHLERVISK